MASQTRLGYLMREAADAFERQTSPFETQWLVDHEVTFHECGDLSDAIAGALRFALVMMGEDPGGDSGTTFDPVTGVER